MNNSLESRFHYVPERKITTKKFIQCAQLDKSQRSLSLLISSVSPNRSGPFLTALPLISPTLHQVQQKSRFSCGIVNIRAAPATFTWCRLFKFCRSESLFVLLCNSIFYFAASLIALLSSYFLLSFCFTLETHHFDSDMFLTRLHTHNYLSVKVITPLYCIPCIPTYVIATEVKKCFKLFFVLSLYC